MTCCILTGAVMTIGSCLKTSSQHLFRNTKFKINFYTFNYYPQTEIKAEATLQ